MKRTTKESWLPHIKAWENSNLSQAEFCRREGLHYTQFCYHCKKQQLTKASEPSKNTANNIAKNVFVPLTSGQLTEALMGEILTDEALTVDRVEGSATGGQSGIKLCFAGVIIEIERSFCAKTLSAILTVLDERC